jgi:hypothetical protein
MAYPIEKLRTPAANANMKSGLLNAIEASSRKAEPLILFSTC